MPKMEWYQVMDEVVSVFVWKLFDSVFPDKCEIKFIIITGL